MAPSSSRRRLLAAVAAGVAGGLAGCGSPSGSAPSDGLASPTTSETARDGESATGGATATGTAGHLPDEVALEPVATGFRAPLDLAFAPDADRRYVLEQGGTIHVHGPDGLREEPFFDLGEAGTYGGEKGLLGMALHPGFADNRRVFLRYSAPPREGTPDGYSHTFVLAEFAATDDGRGLRPDSERTVLEIPEPQGNHNAGDLGFGPDGYLYVAVGDGGAAADQGTGHVADWYDAVPGGNGQDVTENLLGSMLRIDVDGNASGSPSDRGASAADYAVPGDNPLVGATGLDELYAWGLRNPWRFSFDPEGSLVDGGPDLLVGDVGQRRWEEVDVVRRGGNYGWNVTEGRHCFRADDCPDATPEGVRGGEALLDPVVEYPHGGAAVSGISVIGGVVVRGDAAPSLRGRYVFGDLRPEGRLFVAEPGGDRWSTTVVDAAIAGGGTLSRVLSFARDDGGDAYVLGGGESGAVYRVVEA